MIGRVLYPPIEKFKTKEKKVKKRLFKEISITLIMIMCFHISLFAMDINDLMQQKEGTKNELENATSELEGIHSELSSTLQQIQAFSNTISEYEKEVASLNLKIEEYERNIVQTQKELEVANLIYIKQKNIVEERLVTLYKLGDTSYLDFLLSSKNLTDFISNYFLITKLVSYDTNLLNDTEAKKNEIESHKKKLQEQQKEYDVVKTSANKKSIILKNTMTLRNDYVAKLTDEEKAIQDRIDAYEREVYQIEAEIANLLLVNMDNTTYAGRSYAMAGTRLY